MADEQTLAVVVRRLRRATGLTQQEAAARAGMSLGALRDVEQGRTTQPRTETVRALANALSVELAVLLAASTTPTASPTRTVGIAIAILGPLMVQIDEAPVDLPGRMQATALGLLALHANEFVSHDELISMLWHGEQPGGDGAALMHSYVARLRKRLAGRRRAPQAAIIASRQRYQLQISADRVDSSCFTNIVADARSAEGHHAGQLYLDALACWRGSVLSDIPELRNHPRVVALEQLRVRAALELADLTLRDDLAQSAIAALSELWRQEPFHEGLAARLIQLNARLGHFGDAQGVYSTTRRALADELGLDPSPQLRAAHAELLRRSAAEAPDVATPARTTPVPAQLPAGVRDFAGRGVEAAGAVEFLRGDCSPNSVPIVAITGAGGMGKTSLALHIAHAVAERYPDGQLFVDLHGVGRNPLAVGQVLERFLVALGHHRTTLPTETTELAALYRSVLAAGRYLIVLDNARDVQHVTDLLPGSARCAVVVTSRRALVDLDSGHRIGLIPLSVGASHELLQSVLGADAVNNRRADAHRVVALCGGLPLALRLAATRLVANPGWDLGDLRARLDNAQERLDVLSSQNRAIHACFELSYQDLPTDVARAFRLLSLSDGDDICLDAAAALLGQSCRVTEAALAQLTERSLITAKPGRRFALHDLMRLFAQRQAMQHDPERVRGAALTRLLGWYLVSAHAATSMLYPHRVGAPEPRHLVAGISNPGVEDVDSAAAWLDTEGSNLLRAVARAAAEDLPEHAWLLADAAAGMFRRQQLSHEWLAAAQIGLAAARATNDPRGLAMMHESLGRAHAARTDFDTATSHYREAVAYASQSGWTQAQVSALENLAIALWSTGELGDAMGTASEALHLARHTGQRYFEAACLNDIGNVLLSQGELAEAEKHYTLALNINRELADEGGQGVNLGNLAIVERLRGRFDVALAHGQATLALRAIRSNPTWLSNSLAEMSVIALNCDRLDEAASFARQSLAVAQTIDDGVVLAAALVVNARVQLAAGALAAAEPDLHRALALAREVRSPQAEIEALLTLADHAEAAADLERCAEFASQAREISARVSDTINEGLALLRLATIASADGDVRLAVQLGTEAQDRFVRTGHRPGLVRVHELLDQVRTA